MAKPFYVTPILNSLYHVPTRHHCLDEQGQPLDHPPANGRRRSKYLTPVPKARRRRPEQAELALHTQEGEPGTYSENALVNEIRGHVASWRALPNPNDWGVTPATQKLLQHWRHHAFQGPRCLISGFDGAVFSQRWKDALWARFTTGAPRRQRLSVERYSIVKRA